jgi:hypothetical protein
MLLSSDENHLALFMDHEGLRRALSRHHLPLPAAAELARAAVRFCQDLGHLVVARVYDDWSAHQAEPQAFRDQHLEPRLVLSMAGPGALLCLALDAVAYAQSPRAAAQLVLCSGEPTLSHVTLRLRELGQRVLVIAPAALAESGIAVGAHRFVPLEDMLRLAGGDAPDKEWNADDYDFGRFVRLVAWLEERLPFVGVGYLIKKAMNHENVGVHDVKTKQAIFQTAQDLGLVEVYYKDNKDEAGDPVAACRLLREHPQVVKTLEELVASGAPLA